MSVQGDGKGLIGHAGAVLLRKSADQTGLTGALGGAFARLGTSPVWDRGVLLIQLAVAIALGARSMRQIALLSHHEHLFGAPPSDSTIRRALEPIGRDERLQRRIARARARVRRHVWDLIAATETGFPWPRVAGKTLTGWTVIDLDATLITAHSDKEGASATFKKGWGFHPLAAWCANTCECLAMLLREGSAGSNTATDHVRVLTEAIAQIPETFRAKIWIRLDAAGATHNLVDHMQGLTTTRRTVRFTVGWKITGTDEAAIAKLPATAWQAAVRQDGEVHAHAQVAELTHLDERAALWGVRLLVRRVRPSARDAGRLTDLEKKTGWKYAIIATNLGPRGLRGIAGSHQLAFIDAAHRDHAEVEDRVRTNKAMGLRNLPSKTWNVNVGWVLAANLAADLDAWTRLLGLHDDAGLARAEPQTLRYCLWHLPARLISHARRRTLKISATWPWKNAFLTCWQRLSTLPAPT
ncbi:IS1380 family transposase [Planomonospora sp. ID82291]|uniref:IS1380 family transposase n=1 Tax=Planomonospora sp. ID82291 TaxID=2738136 RepID=UPI0018C3B2AC|nr:IS1380 family transposase [Planomonospora sp. ID82291]MBG0814277.1 IS1380 family transposase [Planomonospora sp. ID82291]